MKFGLLYELQLPRPWNNPAEHRMIHEALAEVETADQLGFDCVWATEHHFLEEYSHSSAPEVCLAAAAARTKQIHIGHAVMARGNGIGTLEQLRERLLAYQEAGVDQVIFVQQAGRDKHEDIVDSLKLFASEVMPRMKQDAAEREHRKQEELAPYIAAALKPKQWMQPLPRDQIPVVEAYGKTVVAAKEVTNKPTYRIGAAGGFEVPMEDLAARRLGTAAE